MAPLFLSTSRSLLSAHTTEAPGRSDMLNPPHPAPEAGFTPSSPAKRDEDDSDASKPTESKESSILTDPKTPTSPQESSDAPSPSPPTTNNSPTATPNASSSPSAIASAKPPALQLDVGVTPSPEDEGDAATGGAVNAHTPTSTHGSPNNTNTGPNNLNTNTNNSPTPNLNNPPPTPLSTPPPSNDTPVTPHPQIQTGVPRASQAPTGVIAPGGGAVTFHSSRSSSGVSSSSRETSMETLSRSSLSRPSSRGLMLSSRASADGGVGVTFAPAITRTGTLHTRQNVVPSVAPGPVETLPDESSSPAIIGSGSGTVGGTGSGSETETGSAGGQPEASAPTAPSAGPTPVPPAGSPLPARPEGSAPAPAPAQSGSSSVGNSPSLSPAPAGGEEEEVPSATAPAPTPAPTPNSTLGSASPTLPSQNTHSGPAASATPTPTPAPPSPTPTVPSDEEEVPSSTAPVPEETSIGLSNSHPRPNGPLADDEDSSPSEASSTSADASLPTPAGTVKSPSQGQVAVVEVGDEGTGTLTSSSTSPTSDPGSDSGSGGRGSGGFGGVVTGAAESVTSTLTSTFTSSIAVGTTTDARGRVETSFSRVVGTSTVVTVVPGARGSGVAKGSFEEDGSGKIKGAIGGGVVGAVLVIVGLLVGIIWLRRRKYRREMAVHRRLFESPVTTPEPISPTSPSHYFPTHTTAQRDAALAHMTGRPLAPAVTTNYATFNENQVRRVPPPPMRSLQSPSPLGANANPFADPPALVAGSVSGTGAGAGFGIGAGAGAGLSATRKALQKVTYPALVPSRLGMESVTASGGEEGLAGREKKAGVMWWDEKGKTGSLAGSVTPPDSTASRRTPVGPMPVFDPAPTPAGVQADPFADPVIGEESRVKQMDNPFEDLLDVAHAERAGAGSRASFESRVSVGSASSGSYVAPGYAL